MSTALSQASVPPRPSNPYGHRAQAKPWSTYVNTRRMELLKRLEDLPPERRLEPAYRTAVECLDAADEAAHEREDRFLDRLASWWSGERVERGWTAIHQAEDAIVEMEPDSKVIQDIPALREQLVFAVGPRDARFLRWSAEMANMAEDKKLEPSEREALGRIRQLIHRATDDRHRGIRAFRNLVLLTALAISAMLVIAVIWHVISREFLSLCTTAGGKTTCVSGNSTSRSIDVALVVGVGLLAGLVSGLLSLGKMGEIRSPYNLPGMQVLLKAVAGAATALLGIIILQSGLVVEAAAASGAATLAYAAVFGSSQELFTRAVDRHASQLTEDKG